MVKTSPSNAVGEKSTLGRGAKIPHASQSKNQNIKQKQYCTTFNTDFKIVHIIKKKKKKLKKTQKGTHPRWDSSRFKLREQTYWWEVWEWFALFKLLLKFLYKQARVPTDVKEAHRTRGVSGTLQGSTERGDLVNSKKECYILLWWFGGLVAKLCPTLCNPTDCSSPGSSVHGILRQEYFSGCHFLLQGIFSMQESNPGLLHCRQILYWLSYEASPKYYYTLYVIIYYLVSVSWNKRNHCTSNIHITQWEIKNYKIPLRWRKNIMKWTKNSDSGFQTSSLSSCFYNL